MGIREIWETAIVARAVGGLRTTAASMRRARALAMPRRGPRPLSHEEIARASWALLRSPSPLWEGDDDQRWHQLDAQSPGSSSRALERALANAHDVETVLCNRTLGREDPRLSWEEARLARLVSIGIGIRLARSSVVREELCAAFCRGVLSWKQANPPPRGPGFAAPAWESPLEVALRAWNLWVATLLSRPALLPRAGLMAVATLLLECGRFLWDHLEEDGLATGTHLLGELVGLHACGVALGALGREPRAFRARARSGLLREAGRQVLPDGGGSEASTGYSRFACELWIAEIACARAQGEPILPPAWRAAKGMLGWLLSTMTPDGRDPGVGDDDSSCVLPPPVQEPRDVLRLAPLGVSLFGDTTRLEGTAWSELAAWLTGPRGYRKFAAVPTRPWPREVASRSFGLFVARQGSLGGDMVSVRAGAHGQGGAGGHAHNDPLAATAWLGGWPVLVDSGTGLYLGRRALRDRFRGVAAHATACVDGLEPSPILGTRPFALPDRARARLLSLDDDGDTWCCVVMHVGYRARGSIHRREVRFARSQGELVLTDVVTGRPGDRSLHEVCLSFPVVLPPEIIGRRVRLGQEGSPVAWLEAAEPEAPFRVDRSAVSPRYGVVVPAWVVRRVGRVMLPVVLTTRVSRHSTRAVLDEEVGCHAVRRVDESQRAGR
ncbi:MAG: alginate lyase family protein [Deltaproteobacteria bacterium]|nr:alginate lyase family protein [Deltaproteobacteria bacterium]